jgi:hypothetical protein
VGEKRRAFGRRFARLVACGAAILAVVAGLIVPRFGEGAAFAGPENGPQNASPSIPPDPPPLFEKGQWVFDLRWDKGDVFLLGVHRVELAAPQSTPRAMGRFALELYEGPTLVERVRFDFPLLGAGAAVDAGRSAPPSFETKLVTRVGVMFPATNHGTKLQLWDRATDRRWPLAWPPEEQTGLDASAEGSVDRGR